MEISIRGNAREIAALIAAIQETPEVQKIQRKKFSDLTAEDFARLSEAQDGGHPTIPVCTDKGIQDSPCLAPKAEELLQTRINEAHITTTKLEVPLR